MRKITFTPAAFWEYNEWIEKDYDTLQKKDQDTFDQHLTVDMKYLNPIPSSSSYTNQCCLPYHFINFTIAMTPPSIPKNCNKPVKKTAL
jgi:hypothetical protein